MLTMSKFLLIAVFTGGLWVVDALLFDGKFTKDAWHEAQSVGRQVRYEVAAQVRFHKF